MIKKQQFCTFFIDGFFYGVEVGKVQEVLRPQEMTPVPLAPAVVMGLINLRGQIVPAIDLRRSAYYEYVGLLRLDIGRHRRASTLLVVL